ncbi:MAG: HRDC domain-containing protein [Bacteroidota bacterium]
MITSRDDLAALCDRARQQVAVAIDTEFVWERTYYPALGVVQVGLGPDDVHLIDTLALTGDDLAPLASLLADPDTEVVLHDALQDLQILHRATGALPQNVFDTQRAAGLVGQTATASLQDLVEWVTGVRLEKGATRTNWLQRPLSDRQIPYAEDDVRYLLDVRDKLVDEADARDRLGWIDEEMDRYEDPADYTEADPVDAVDRVKSRGIGKLGPQERAVLRHVAAWREREARRLDRTRRMVLPDDALVEIATRRPRSEQDLGRVLTGRQAKRYADGLLAAVRDGEAADPEPRARRGRPGPEEDRRQAQLNVLQGLVAGQCTLGDVDPQLVATKAHLTALVHAGTEADPADHPVLRGWRRPFVGEDLLTFLRGEGTVQLHTRDGWPRST